MMTVVREGRREVFGARHVNAMIFDARNGIGRRE